MLILLSPAKNLNEDRATGHATSQPRFTPQADELMAVMQTWSEQEISDLMKVSPKIAALNHARFAAWSQAPNAAQAAGYMFDGDVYQTLEMHTLDPAARHHADRRLRILSGLYGLLRPGDDIQAYRLEMGRKIPGHAAGTLYKFWGPQIAEAIVQDARDIETDVLLNLASDEYAKSVDRSALSGLSVVSPRFEDEKGSTRKMISFSAKRARGAMARWVLETGCDQPQDLARFTVGGYRYDPETSAPQRPVFVRTIATA